MSSQYQTRVANIEKILLLENLCIDEHALKGECKFGIPDKFRPLIWRLFLGFMPLQRHQWAETLKQQRAHYATLVDQFFVGPSSSNGDDRAEQDKDVCADKEPSNHDHPLADADESGWTGWFRDNDVVRQINNDVMRLRPEIDFFQRRTAYPIKTRIKLSDRLTTGFLRSDSHIIDKLADKSFIPSKNSSNNNNIGHDEQQLHTEVVGRILFLFAKTNRGIGYVQGFNEIICPIYFVFATDPDDEWARHAEADCFYCFQNLISEFKDLFIGRMDSEHCGIEAVLTCFFSRFKANDPELYSHLVERQQMKPQYFAFRWISLLLSQEFSLPDVIAIWDSLFASPPGARLDRVQAVCLAILSELREALFGADFGHNLRTLQNFSEASDDIHITVPRLIVRSLQMLDDMETGRKDDKNNNDNNSGKKSGGNDRFGSPALAEVKTRFRSLLDSANSKLVSMHINSSGSKEEGGGKGKKKLNS